MKQRKNRKETVCMSGLGISLVGLILAVMRMEAAGISLGMMLAVVICMTVLWLCSYQLRYRPTDNTTSICTARVSVRSDRAA